MRPLAYQCYRDSEMLQDAFIVLAPPILAFVGVLWFFGDIEVLRQRRKHDQALVLSSA